MGPRAVSFVERSNILCPYLRGSLSEVPLYIHTCIYTYSIFTTVGTKT